jgi:hypothetical protein
LNQTHQNGIACIVLLKIKKNFVIKVYLEEYLYIYNIYIMSNERNTYGVKIYIYALIDENEQIIYVGKSNTPKPRLANHKCNLNNSNLKMKILDYFYDVEQYWVDKLIQEGHNLINKEFFIHSEEWEKGDIIDTNRKSAFKIYDSELNIIYSSMYELSKVIQMDFSQFQARINKPEKYKEFAKYQIIQ